MFRERPEGKLGSRLRMSRLQRHMADRSRPSKPRRSMPVGVQIGGARMSADAKSTRAERGGSGKSTRTKLQVPTKSERAMRQPSCQSHPQPERSPLLDERVPALLIDATESVTAAIASATTKLSYREAHQAMAVNCEKKRELIGAIQELVDKHRTFFTVNKAVIEFGV